LKLPSPSTRNIVVWVLSAYEEIEEATIRKTFLSIEFVMSVEPKLDVDFEDGNDNNDDSSDEIDLGNILLDPSDENKSSDNERIVRNP
jgi:hypothetical protein